MTSAKDPHNAGGDMMEIDPTFASTLGLEARQKVTIIIHANPQQAHTVYLDPLTNSDWEIVETHAAFLESWMINQVRAVSVNHPITVYPSPTSVASLAVVKIEPEPRGTGPFSFAKLSPDSEVIIAPKTLKKTAAATQTIKSKDSSIGSKSKKSGGGGSPAPCVLLRGVTMPHVQYEELQGGSKPLALEVYADPDAVLYPLRGAEYVTVSVVKPAALQTLPVQPPAGSGGGASGAVSGVNSNGVNGGAGIPSAGANGSDDIISASSVVARLVDYRNGVDGHVGLSYALGVALGISGTVGNVIRLEAVAADTAKSRQSHPSKLIIHPVSTVSAPNSLLKLRGSNNNQNGSTTSVEDRKAAVIKEALLENGILSNGAALTNYVQLPPIGENILPLGCVIEFDEGSENEWFLLTGKQLPLVTLGNEVLRPESSISPTLDSLTDPSILSARPVVGIDKYILTASEAVRAGNKGTLIYGSRVSGKTVVLKELEIGLNQDLVHTIWFSCAVHADKQIHALKDILRKLFLEAAWFSPSVIIFDDLDKLIPAEMEHADSSKTRQLAEVFKQLIESTASVRKVSILASTQNKGSLHSSLITSHVFEEILHLKSPDKYVRETILNEALNSLGLVKESGFDVVEVAGSTEGYQPGDLWTLVERANHEVLLQSLDEDMDNNHEPYEASEMNGNGYSDGQAITHDPGSTKKMHSAVINQSHFDSALKDFTPSSLRGVKLQKSTVSWSDIGGLNETKRVILETLEWPTRYAPIFANCPLRLRSGLLLYGYPGCGKTLLASAVAAQCGLNFISIKGPEILNKYIGASEQSVRDLFDRAQAAKPCILFFDEFDSIAPKRGHDSTGVTDRVVNQMLTQMDGAEGLDGVYVLAATSRPDLIDSALLRPGRLDKSLICDLPNLVERLDILKAVQGDMRLSDDIDLRSVAEQTDGYSGADLQGLLYNAYMDAIHEVVDVIDEDDGDDNEDGDYNDDSKNEKGDIEFFQIDTHDAKVTNKSHHHHSAERAQLTKKLEVIMGKSNSVNDIGTETGTKATDVVILTHHLAKSLVETKPSISVKERNKLAAIYHQFVAGRSGDMPTGNSSTDIGGRATLM